MMDLKEIDKIVLLVREELRTKYPDNINLSGLCNISVTMLMDKLIDIGIDESLLISMHGELTHSPAIESNYWPIEHTMLTLVLDGKTIWIDPTSEQFKDIIPNIPDYIISNHKPKWFYPDERNPAYSGPTKYINRIRFHTWYKDQLVYGGLIEFIQYNIWGRLSDIIRKIKR